MGGISVMLLMGMLSAMYMFFIAVIAVLIIYFAVSYVFESIAAMGMCKNLYYKHSGTAWIPFYNKYLLGKIAGNKALGIIEGVLNLTIDVLTVVNVLTFGLSRPLILFIVKNKQRIMG